MNTTSLIRTLLPVAIVAVAIPSSAYAQKSSTKAPVEIVQPVEVIGSVEIVGEPYKQPLTVMRSGNLPAGFAVKDIPIEVPAGKRIVIETVSVIAHVAVGSKAQGFLNLLEVDGGGQLAMTFTDQGAYIGGTLFTATASVKLRFDSNEVQPSFTFIRSGGNSAASCSVTLFGYIEEL